MTEREHHGELKPASDYPQKRRIDMWIAGALAENERGTLQLQAGRGQTKWGNPRTYYLMRYHADGTYDTLLHKLKARSDAAAIGVANAWLATRRIQWSERQRRAIELARHYGLNTWKEST